MAVDERIVAAVTPIVAVCEPDEYTPESGEAVSDEYCTYNFTEIPEGFGNNGPRTVRCLVQVHWFLPRGRRPRDTKLALCRALCAAGFTYPRVENVSDSTGQHYVFECEVLGEV